MAPEHNWAFTDGWILMAVHIAAREAPAALHEVMAYADGINHAIPTSGELTRALSRLVQAGVVVVSEGAYAIESVNVTAIDNATKGAGLFTSIDRATRWLGTSNHTLDPSRGAVFVSDEDAQEAYERYIREFRAR